MPHPQLYTVQTLIKKRQRPNRSQNRIECKISMTFFRRKMRIIGEEFERKKFTNLGLICLISCISLILNIEGTYSN